MAQMSAKRLQQWQARMGFNQLDAAAALNVPPATYRNWLHDRRAIPSSVALLCLYVEHCGLLPPSIRAKVS